MSQNLASMIAAVRDWSNRESDVLSDDTIKRCIRWAIDKAVRTLRIAPMEYTVTYTGVGELSSNLKTEGSINGRTVSSFLLPADYIEVISISTIDEASGTIRMFDTKVDERTFFGPRAEQYSIHDAYTKKGNRIYIQSSFPYGTEVSLELRYYRRPFDIDAVYSIDPANLSTSYLKLADTQAGAAADGEGFLQINNSLGSPVTNPANAFDVGNVAAVTSATAIDTGAGIHKFAGLPVFNWFMDSNERLVIYGALAEVFAYLQEDDQLVKYQQLYTVEYGQLMNEEARQKTLGGNIQMNFNGGGFI